MGIDEKTYLFFLPTFVKTFHIVPHYFDFYSLMCDIREDCSSNKMFWHCLGVWAWLLDSGPALTRWHQQNPDAICSLSTELPHTCPYPINLVKYCIMLLYILCFGKPTCCRLIIKSSFCDSDPISAIASHWARLQKRLVFNLSSDLLHISKHAEIGKINRMFLPSPSKLLFPSVLWWVRLFGNRTRCRHRHGICLQVRLLETYFRLI